jgi:hypothetical protein
MIFRILHPANRITTFPSRFIMNSLKKRQVVSSNPASFAQKSTFPPSDQRKPHYLSYYREEKESDKKKESK